MTYALAWPLQQAVHARLAADAGVAARVADRIWDAAPGWGADAGASGPGLILGDETAEDWSSGSGRGAAHVFRVAVVAPREGYAEAKRAAGAVCDALIDADLALSRGAVVCLGFVGAETGRLEGKIGRAHV